MMAYQMKKEKKIIKNKHFYMEKTPDTDLYKFEYAFPTICGEFYSSK